MIIILAIKKWNLELFTVNFKVAHNKLPFSHH